MSTFGVMLTKIDKVWKHKGADRLDVAKIEGCTFQFVVLKDQFKIGDEVLYFPVDAVLPEPVLVKMGLSGKLAGPKHNRVKTICLRKIMSQGIVASPKTFFDDSFDYRKASMEEITAKLGVIKYEPPSVSCQNGKLLPLPDGVGVYDIEGTDMHPDVVEKLMDVLVSITEKLEGCFLYNSLVKMADGTTKRIFKIKKGDFVLSLDENNKVVESEVLNVFKNGLTEDWINIKCTKTNISKSGNSYISIICTPNHRVWSVDRKKYIKAKDLLSGEKVLSVRSDLAITPIQEQIILGKLLGDGSLRQIKNSAALEYSHSEKYSDYVEWTKRALGDISTGEIQKRISGKGSHMEGYVTSFLFDIKNKFSNFYVNGQKVVPHWIKDKITPIALAFWYMDDGSLAHDEGQQDRITLSVCDFSKKDCDVLIDALKKFDIYAVYYEDKRGPYPMLRLNSDDAEKFFLLIAPYICKGMQYKLPERYRSHSPWIPKKNMQYKRYLIQQEVISIKKLEIPKQQKYDIETQHHNYFVSNLLVHNSNFSVTVKNNGKNKDQEVFVSQREFTIVTARTTFEKIADFFKDTWRYIRRRKWKKHDKHFFWRVAENQGLIVTAKKIQEKYPDKQVTLRGEFCGEGSQGNIYNLRGNKVFLFDIKVDFEYLPVEEFFNLCKEFNLETVPLLAKGVTLREWLNGKDVSEASNGTSVLCKIRREGIVIKPMQEMTHETLGRLIVKKRSGEYLANSDA